MTNVEYTRCNFTSCSTVKAATIKDSFFAAKRVPETPSYFIAFIELSISQRIRHEIDTMMNLLMGDPEFQTILREKMKQMIGVREEVVSGER